MATAKKSATSRRAKQSPQKSVSSGIVTNDSDPQSWLFLNPLREPLHKCMVFGVLRRTYGDRTNSAALFGRCKLQPVEPEGSAIATPWPVTAERVDVLLPPGADDRFRDPYTLLSSIDAEAVKTERALLTYITIAFPDADRLHSAYEVVRAFAYQSFARDRQLATLCVQHSPGRVASSNPVHLHLCIVPRRLTGLGFGPYDPDLCHDRGQRLCHDLWTAFEAAW